MSYSPSGNAMNAPAARICRWYAGKKAALSLRFDDSHPTHIQIALPLLNEYGCTGTFLVNPGDEGYRQFRSAWEGALPAAGHELGNHGFHHRGAETDQDAEIQFGRAAEMIRQADPARTRLLVVVRGGATQWMQRKPFDFFVAKYRLLNPPREDEMSCREDVPWKPGHFTERLDQAIAEGGWMRAHFHCLGSGYLPISLASFRAVLEAARSRRDDVWQSGMNSIASYQDERDRSFLWACAGNDDAVILDLACEVDADIHTHPLTLEVALPAGVESASVLDRSGNPVEARVEKADGGLAIRFDAMPADSAYEVRAKGLGAAYREAYGPDLSAPGPHPHLFFRQEDLPALREKMLQAPAKELWDGVKAEADRILGTPHPARLGSATTCEQARASAENLRTLAAVHALTGDMNCADRAAAEIEVILAADTWVHPSHVALGIAPDLVVAEITCNLGLAYDWMHDVFTGEQRSRVLEGITRRGLEPIVEASAKNAWWTCWSKCNWGAVIYGQAGVAALSILSDEPRAVEWVRLLRKKLWHFGQAIGRDGSWGESASYACYAWSNGVMFIEALRCFTKGRVNLFENPRMRRMPEWFAHLLTPDESGFVPFSNCARGARLRGQFLYRLAGEYGDGRALWLARRMASQGIFGFLWCDPDLAPKTPSDLPLAKIFKDIDWAFLRSRWDDPEATLFALKGGQKDWDHAHHDTNHFVLFAHGEPLIVDLFYPHEIWGCKTEAHNTIMVNGREQAGRVNVAGGRDDPMHRGVISDLVESPWYSRLVGDASLAYDPKDVNSFVREVLYLRSTGAPASPEYFVLFDDVDATAPARYDWLLHTYGSIERAGNRLTIAQGRAAVDVTVVSPADLACEFSEKLLKDIKCEPPAEGIEKLRQARLHAAQSPGPARGSFVSVLVPRLAATPADSVNVSAVNGANLRGAEIAFGGTRDLALFALDAPLISAFGVEARARTCFARRSGGNVTHAALHGGDRLAVNGVTLFETDASGSMAACFSDQGVHCVLYLYNAVCARVHAARRPSRVKVGGREQEFKYDPQTRLAEFALDGGMVEEAVDVVLRY